MMPTGVQARLNAGCQTVRALMVARGFAVSDQHGVASGGAFATMTFRRGPLEIGLIARDGGLGCPNYSIGTGYVGHQDLMKVLGAAEAGSLVPGNHLAYRHRDGEDPFEALVDDFRRFVLPMLDRSEADFREAVVAALALQKEWRGW